MEEQQTEANEDHHTPEADTDAATDAPEDTEPLVSRDRFARAARYEVPELIFTNRLSDASYSAIEHFGVEAPGLLNNYACSVEDALIEQLRRGNDLRTKLAKALYQIEQLNKEENVDSDQ